MSTLSVPLTPHLEEFINRMVKSHVAANKAEVVRQALLKYEEDQAIATLMEARRDVKEGRIFYGDLDEIMKQMP